MPVSLLVTRPLPAAVAARARAEFDATFNPTAASYSPEELIANAEGKEALLISPSDSMNAEMIARLPASVRMVATFSVGYEHIDLAAARARGLAISNTPDVLTDATADIALLLMLSVARRAGEAERVVRAGQWGGWAPSALLGRDVTRKSVGIVGMGRIGRAFAKRARALDMQIHYSNRRRLSPELEQGAIYHADADEMLPLVDFLSLHCPSTPETYKWLNADRIARLKPTAYVINTARGAIVDDAALIAALQDNRLGGAGLDVFDGEPNLNPGYLTLENAVLLPHIGSATIETRDAMGFKALDNLAAFFAGQEAPDRLA
jgi:lactate dehydrogenase-like 2-hydroxyacid dehydrogenase